MSQQAGVNRDGRHAYFESLSASEWVRKNSGWCSRR
jgi:hypothetical protein